MKSKSLIWILAGVLLLFLCVSSVSAAVVANFSASPNPVTVSSPVSFTDLSTGSPSSWAWYFGDETYNGAWTGFQPYQGFTPITGDWEGLDARTNVGTFKNGIFYLDFDNDFRWDGAVTDRQYASGASGDIPVAGDWNNDGKSEIGVFRPSTHTFYLDLNGNGAFDDGAGWIFSFGLTGDIPVAGDWNNDGLSEIGVFRSGIFLLDFNGNHLWDVAIDKQYNFGMAGDLPVAGVWNGAGADKIGVYRPSTSQFLLDASGDGAYGPGDFTSTFSSGQNQPLSGDWLGEGKTEIGTFKDGIFALDWDGTGTWASGGDWNTDWTTNGWAGRYAHSSVVLPDGSIVLMGGNTAVPGGNFINDVWRSTDKGTTWTQQTSGAGWSGRYAHSSVALPDGNIVLMGGWDGSATPYKNDVWLSTDKGATWTEQTSSAGWSGRYSHSSVAMPDGSIVVMGGLTASGNTNDVWHSDNQGVSWHQHLTGTPWWTERRYHSSVVTPDNSIVLTGGSSTIGGNEHDVWRSDNYGATWTQLSDAGWAVRWGHTSVVMPDGSIVVMGGEGSVDYNDVWRSTDNGVTWSQVDTGADWTGRPWASSVVVPDGSIVLMGGYNNNGPNQRMGDTWRINTAGSSSSYPPMKFYSSSGIYKVALQVADATGYSSKQGTVTVNAPASTAQLTLVKTVINDNGGTKGVADFPLFVSGGGVLSGVKNVFTAGTHNVSETQQAGYTASVWGGDCNAGGLINLTPGDDKTCTITNNDNAPALHLRKVVVNDNGGGWTAFNWTLAANGPTPLSGITPVDSGPGFLIGNYTLNESGSIGYTASPWVCVGGTQSGSHISVGLGESATCTITNNDNPPTPTITVTSPNGGEIWYIGSTHPIRWTSTNVPGTSVDISAVYGGSTTVPITYGEEIGSGSYVWTIPQDWVARNDYVIKVTSSSDPAIYDVSDGTFAIDPLPPGVPMQAYFSKEELNEGAPLNVQFTDRSTGLPDARSWDFGDGSTSTEKDPFHTFYEAGGSYKVTLTVTKGSESSMNYMMISAGTDYRTASFKYDASNGVIVQFYDMSTEEAHDVLWNFGDGSPTSTVPNPTHTFDLGTDKTRTYWVELYAFYSDAPPFRVTKKVAVAAITKDFAELQVPPPTYTAEFNHITPVPIPARPLVFGGGQSSIPITKPGYLVARYPYHRNGDGPTQLYLVTSEGVYVPLGESQSLPLNAVVEAEDPYGMTKTPYGGANGVVSAETSQTTGGLGPLNLLSKVPVESQSNNYALLIDGGKNANENHIRYWNDISFMYQTLTKVYGYKKANIIVLMTDGGAAGVDRHYATENSAIKTDSSSSDFDGDGSAETVGIASKTNLITTLYNLNTSKTSSDHLFIFTTGHGGQISGNDVKYYLWNGDEITDAEFVNALPDKFGDITLVMEQCNGGGFIDNFQNSFHTGYGDQKRIIHTAASASESSYGNAFSNVWTRSAAMVTDRVQPTTEADTNIPDAYDGKINMQEAFNFAKNTDPAATGALLPFLETPQEKYINFPGPTTKFLASSGWAVPNTIIVAVPNIVETWYAGFDRPIAWTSRGVTNVKIQLYNSTSPGTYYDLKSTTAAVNGKWTWLGTDTSNINAGNSAGTRTYKIKITDVNVADTNDMSDQYFYIKRGGTSGSLKVNSNIAGAKIYLDGMDTALTTVVGNKEIQSSASPGTHTIALTGLTGYLDQEKMITKTSSSAELIVSFTLLAIDSNAGYRDDDAGSMTITATPPEARISIDGVDQGTTLFKQKVIPGIDWEAYPHKYNAEVKLDGWIPKTKDVEVARGQTAYADFVLKGDPAWYKFTGFDAPVDMGTVANPVVNIGNAGRNIPLKWHLSDGKGVDVSNSAKFNVIFERSVCGAALPDEIEEYDPNIITPGLKYQGNGEWHYNWKTLKTQSFIGQCWNVYLVFDNDVRSPVAQFKFR